MAPAPAVDAALLDTYSLLFRAFHALPPLNTSRGEPTSGLYGFAALVIKILREQRPRGLAFALDAPARTFREERYAAYKAGRPKLPAELATQLGRLPELLEAFGVPTFCVPGFEADDVLATLTRRLREEGKSVLVVSGDRDLLQLVGEGASVLFVGARGQQPTTFDRAAVEARFGVPPEKLPSLVALVGDPSDNLIGAPGVGPRTASKLILEYGSVAGILEKLDAVRARAVQEALRENAERLLMNEELARLRADIDLECGDPVRPVDEAAVRRLTTLFQALEFKSLIARLPEVQCR